MSAIILGWDPARWNQWNYAAVVEHVAVTGLHLEPWAVRRGVAAGADAWLLLLGAHGPGLIGHGVVLSDQPEPATNQDAPTISVQVAFDALLPLGDQVPANVLLETLPGLPWDSVEQGAELAPGDEAGVRALWAEFGPGQGPDPTLMTPGTYPDGAVARLAVNRYERDPVARRACMAHRGTNCAVCGFSFEMAYGELGAGFIPIHHVVPASELGSSYQLDPLTDLVPLCANCHAMAHHGVSSPRSVAELRQIIASAGYVRGTTVTSEELEAQRIAREVLGPQ
ncbi:HNH endonuclease [Pseudarthrobacter sulfonivorans]|uniref:HNH endonuclease n=1 Tax=Pseudarthrobacter sulfonivorans TaxID=121292 RepID=UPI002861E48F|nr:HNH endonuclease [Pseudarthrobacter sulfonivorans]MDR6415475.1 5-methylcytosine-specific restriction protein A [Pseudarthrobacter sulfonivorans]